MIRINDGLEIPEDEIQFSAEPSSKPGGQHANKASTRVVLTFDVPSSPTLSDEQKRLVQERLGSRISKEGRLRITAQESRSYTANKKSAAERFSELLAGALIRKPPRKTTRIPAASRRRRMKNKRKRADLKQRRKRPLSEDEI